jgi:hypothetical protein
MGDHGGYPRWAVTMPPPGTTSSETYLTSQTKAKLEQRILRIIRNILSLLLHRFHRRRQLEAKSPSWRKPAKDHVQKRLVASPKGTQQRRCSPRNLWDCSRPIQIDGDDGWLCPHGLLYVFQRLALKGRVLPPAVALSFNNTIDLRWARYRKKATRSSSGMTCLRTNRPPK